MSRGSDVLLLFSVLLSKPSILTVGIVHRPLILLDLAAEKWELAFPPPAVMSDNSLLWPGFCLITRASVLFAYWNLQVNVVI